jgi:hypothetical protein
MKRLTMLALVMAIAFGVAIVVLPSDERIDIGRPLGAMYITFSKKLTYERRGTSAYAVIRKDYDSGQLVRTLQAGIKYLPRPPMGWEDATWPVRAGMVARDLLDAKHPGRTGRTCWVGTLQRSPNDWMALPYQQTFYNSEGFADENYRGIFLIFKPPTGGALLLDLFKRRQDPKGIRDWQQVRDYLLEVNEVIESVRDAPCAGHVGAFTKPPTCWSASVGSSTGPTRRASRTLSFTSRTVDVRISPAARASPAGTSSARCASPRATRCASARTW